MALNLSEQRFFELLIQREINNPSKPLNEQSINEFRQGALLLNEFSGKAANVVTADDFVTARDGHQIPIRIFNASLNTPGPLLIMFPGGGYVINTFEANSIACSRIAKFSGQKIILVNYRLLPENPMPTPINDAYDVTEYIANHPDKFKLDPKKLILGGHSAGAHCAAVVSYLAQKNKQFHINQQILLNGGYNALLKKRPYAEYEAKDLMVSREAVNYIYKLWNVTEEQLRLPEYSPYYIENTKEYPKTTIVVAEYDGMRSDSEEFFLKLKASGCDVYKQLLPGESHNTILLRGAITDGVDPAKVIAEIFLNS